MMTRRTLLAMAPALITTCKSDSRYPIVGSGEFQYEMISDWGELPQGLAYGNTHGVCEDSQGQVYIHHTVNKTSEKHDTMVVYDAQGKFVKSWGAEFEGGAHGLHIHKEGRDEFLYLCDTKRALVVKTTLSGEKVFTLEYPKESPAYGAAKIKYSPTNLAIAPNGDIYVGDGYARQKSAAAGRRSRQCAPPVLHARRKTRQLRRRHQSAMPFQRAPRSLRDPRSRRARDAARSR